MTSPSAHRDASREPERPDRTIAALATAQETSDATTFALRYGLARRPGEGLAAGVCTALAHAYGLPVRLVRTWTLALVFLGPGLFVYLVFYLALPRLERGRARGGAEARQGADEPHYDTPARALVRRRPQPGDLVVALLLFPSLALGVAIVWAYIAYAPIVLAFLVPISAVLGVIVVWGGWRASRARTTYLFMRLAEQAGIIDDREALRTLARLRREAPNAWGVEEDPSSSGASGEHAAQSLRGRTVLWLFAAFIFLGVAVFSLVSYLPGLFPALNPNGPLEVVPRVGVGAAAIALASGAVLIIAGARGMRSRQILAFGIASLLIFSVSVSWVRLTDSRGKTPIYMSVDEFQPGSYLECTPGGIREWSRPVVIDLSNLGDPPTDEEARASWTVANGEPDPLLVDLSLTIMCNRPVGNIKVILPEEDWRVNSTLASTLGTTTNSEAKGYSRWDPSHVTIQIDGRTIFGDVTYVREGAKG
ncbi:PspC domain-containing protein [Dermabacter sp. p3-SID358]|uniref:PspC domain-containing protein n=1 Tax=Dermabacter sp. p3-SID358 TaxID=2916114 RepID=UPI0021A79D77|nr:PspC domain-containing protein [Dermabacter sp. p3-SID358]MCT1866242.1 PspC domain-containing protein [Dermabacter sp. p3-SID358]